MYSVYLRWHDDSQVIEQQTRTGDAGAALAAYRALLARDLDGQKVAAVLRDQGAGRTLLFSRFDMPEQRLRQDDTIVTEQLLDDADTATRAIVAARDAGAVQEVALPQLLKAYRARIGVTQKSLAERWGVSLEWVRKAEQGGRVASEGALCDLLRQVASI